MVIVTNLLLIQKVDNKLFNTKVIEMEYIFFCFLSHHLKDSFLFGIKRRWFAAY